MSNAPVYRPRENTLGIVGFVVALFGFTCGLGFPIGFVLSLIALKDEPKGFAIAGTIIGGLGTLAFLVIAILYGAVIVACLTAGAAMQPMLQTGTAVLKARATIEKYEQNNGMLPDEATGNGLIAGNKDGWKKQLRYEIKPEGGFRIRSAGRDGQFNTGDDITSDNLPDFEELDQKLKKLKELEDSEREDSEQPESSPEPFSGDAPASSSSAHNMVGEGLCTTCEGSSSSPVSVAIL